MTRFVDGPAAGESLLLKRAPKFLRVVKTLNGGWDALDQLNDKPADDENLFAYQRVGAAGFLHIRARCACGFYASASYELVPLQPSDATMRNGDSWRAWALEHRGDPASPPRGDERPRP